MKGFYISRKSFSLLVFLGVIFLLLSFFVPEQPEKTYENMAEASYEENRFIPKDRENTTAEIKDYEKEYEYALVEKVIDGDTIVLDDSRVLRYIGIDTPELRDRMGRVECFALQAKKANEKLVAGKQVRLEKDVSETDKYGRILRYVYVDDIFVNEYLVKEGYARAVSFPPDIKYQNILREAERYARENNKGLWNPEACVGKVKGSFGKRTILSGKNCKYPCGGPDKDCKDFRTQKEAQEFFECCGFSAEYDPMNLDAVGIGDGVACESLP